LLALDDLVVFSAGDAEHGREPWVSDGTADGTRMLRDVAPDGDSDPAELVAFRGDVLFTAFGEGGRAIWRTDGTPEGTRPVIAAGCDPALPADPHGLTRVGTRVFFAASTAGDHCGLTDGAELWVTDGTPEGTQRVADIGGAQGSDPTWLTAVAGTLYFSADDGTHRRELWRSDGTAAGTRMVADIDPTRGSAPRQLTALAGALWFSADDGIHGREPWILVP
jgi:ELWxxDGT repeat protein